jgi:hypothetical protein
VTVDVGGLRGRGGERVRGRSEGGGGGRGRGKSRGRMQRGKCMQGRRHIRYHHRTEGPLSFGPSDNGVISPGCLVPAPFRLGARQSLTPPSPPPSPLKAATGEC